MDFEQIWQDAIKAVVDQIDDMKEKNLLLLIGSQVSIYIANNILTFQCKSPYVTTLLPEYLSAFFREVKRLTGIQSMGVNISSVDATPAMAPAPKPAPTPSPVPSEPKMAPVPPQPMYMSQMPQMGNSLMGNFQSNAMYAGQYNQFGAMDPYMQQIPIAQGVTPHVVNAQAAAKPQLPKFMQEDRINHEKTFENYVTDPENELIFAIAKKIASDPGTSNTNPFYIYGASGIGKTHLLFAIANEIRRVHPEKSLMYMRSEEFIKNYVDSMSSKGKMQNKGEYNYQQVYFKDFFTSQDIFIVDDIQNFIKAPGSRATFFEIIADFLDKPNHQLILASDVPPGNLKGFNERETSRFGSGVCREIYPPNNETRAAITISKCREFHVELSDSIIDYIAKNIRSNVREIEGAIKTLNAVKMTKGELTYEDAVANLQSHINTSNQSTTIDAIKERVSKEYDVSIELMEGASRKRKVSQARSVAMAIASELIPSLSLNDIGRSFNKDHSSVHEAIKRTRKRLDTDQELNATYQKLVLSLKRD